MSVTFSIEKCGTVIGHHEGLGTHMSFGKVSVTDLLRGIKKRDSGALIQDALPWLNADQREFIMTGITPDMWDRLFY